MANAGVTNCYQEGTVLPFTNVYLTTCTILLAKHLVLVGTCTLLLLMILVTDMRYGVLTGPLLPQIPLSLVLGTLTTLNHRRWKEVLFGGG